MLTSLPRPNSTKLAMFHIGLAALYFAVFGLLFATSWDDLTPSGRIGIPIMSTVLPLAHLALAWGSKAKSELSRKLSVALGVLMILVFPVGTILAFFFLPLTQWESSNAKPATEV